MKKKNKNFSKRLNRTVTVVQFAVTIAVMAVTVYKMIPKSEKIKGVDAKILADNTAEPQVIETEAVTVE